MSIDSNCNNNVIIINFNSEQGLNQIQGSLFRGPPPSLILLFLSSPAPKCFSRSQDGIS